MNNVKTHSNISKVHETSSPHWNTARRSRTSQLSVTVNGDNSLTDQYGRDFIHFCTTSYLGLDYAQEIQQGAIKAIQEQATLRIACSRNRCRLALLDNYQNALSDHFNAQALVTLSCSSASAAMLPLLASGIFNGGIKPLMVFDRFAHYSMNHLKALCAEETSVMTIGHNDVTALEDICKTNQHVIYVADSFYSMGGISPINEIVSLQNKYGLGLFYDDSHAMSISGTCGTGYARSFFTELPENTFIVASLAKAFGASGGVILYGDKKITPVIEQYGGPVNWSQSLNAAGIGAGMASLAIHHSALLPRLQKKLSDNIHHFDQLRGTRGDSSPSPVRLIRCLSAEECIWLSTKLAEEGFLTSPVFFPVVPKSSPAIRITLRADMKKEQISAFLAKLNSLMTEREVLNEKPVNF